ncbi:hypothetical protein NC658_31795 [Streptomyces griseoincarnatus]|uniref:Uncharacterized protein n=1 Tax=Streptomyces griseoincarnatus TaxID=29305 RepID=A0ABT0W5A3_STRGI|nr:hypothetical protein [Streptomyces griseoincarnatus]MCM2517781.1 hypothetical protein [Streptomyces griseoincarnatus]
MSSWSAATAFTWSGGSGPGCWSWQVERFSHGITALLHRDPGATACDDRLQLARLERVATSRSAVGLAEGYTGFPFG